MADFARTQLASPVKSQSAAEADRSLRRRMVEHVAPAALQNCQGAASTRLQSSTRTLERSPHRLMELDVIRRPEIAMKQESREPRRIGNVADNQPHVHVVQKHKKYGQTAQQINAIEPRPSPPKCITWLLFHRFARHGWLNLMAFLPRGWLVGCSRIRLISRARIATRSRFPQCRSLPCR